MYFAVTSGSGRLSVASAGMPGGRVDFSISQVTGNRIHLSQNGPEGYELETPERERGKIIILRIRSVQLPQALIDLDVSGLDSWTSDN